MRKNEFIGLMEKYGQEHIIKHLHALSAEEEDAFLKNASGLNFEIVFGLYEKFSKQNDTPAKHKKIAPPDVIDAKEEWTDAVLEIGKKAVADGQTAVTIVAGGQGTRLGYPHPKGMFPVSPIKGKSLFQINCEKVLALSLKYGVNIPLLIMCNPETLEEIRGFFREHRFFGLEEENVFFFTQEMLPSVTPDKKLIIKDKTALLSNPDGHGGSLKALWQSGLLEKLESAGITKIFYCHIDNPLVKVADPLFLGWHIKEKADFSLKVVRKRSSDEKVGNFVVADGKPRMIEYIELPDELRGMKDACGNPVFWAGSIGIHFINTDFIRNINKNGFALPYHRQVKKISSGEDSGERTIWKFETFVFDALPLAGKVYCMETPRDEEFAPLKNRDGADSPDEVGKAMLNFYKKQLHSAGISVAPEAKAEISPLADLKKTKLPASITKDTYIQ